MSEIEDLKQQLATKTRQLDTAIMLLVDAQILNQEQSRARNVLLKEFELSANTIGEVIHKWKDKK